MGTSLKSGFTWRVLFIIIGVTLFFIPANIYASFVAGTAFGSVAVFFTALLVSELVRLSGESLTPQEALLIYYAAGWGGASLPIYYLVIYRSYFVHSPLAWAVQVNGVPIAELVPPWMAPKYGSPAYQWRSLFQWEFALPLLVYTVYFFISLLADVGISTLAAHVLVERLEYPFPFADVDASMAMFLSARETETMKYFLAFFGVGVGYGLIAYVPYVSGVPWIPVPFVDATNVIQEWLPGAALAIPTVLSSYIGSMLFPFKAAVWTLISSFVIWLALTPLFTTSWRAYAPEWASEYIKGMGLVAVLNRSMLRLWFGPMLGFSLAIIAYVVFKVRRELYTVIAALASKRSEQSSVFNPRLSLLLYLAASAASVALYHALVPSVPLWIPAFFVFVFSGLLGLVNAVSAGQLAFPLPSFPYAWHSFVYLASPVRLYEAFAFDPPRGGGGTASFCQQVKACFRIGADPRDLVKIWVIGAVLANAVGLASLEFFWRIAPIPSSAYPMTIYGMLSNAYIDTMLTGGLLRINVYNVGIPFAILLLLLFAGSLAEAKGLPFSSLGLVFGLFATPNAALAILIGSALGNFLMPRLLGGRQEWQRLRGYVIAGELTGEGLVLLLMVIASFLAKAGWLWPW
jgi:hypothetical protein